MKNQFMITIGGQHRDARGTLFFFNDFDMTAIKRFYRIKHPHTIAIRGWRGHRIEQRWFHVFNGAFEIDLIEIDNWDMPSSLLQQTKIVLNAEDNSVLHVPAGFATRFKALSANSEMIIFADYAIEHAKNDDYLFPLDYFNN
ncbi:WxcM-like domain-containing protein [Pedobacter panaciterrae]|jgi:dTDP-4-dehydrorhamnose 3,5-epimerase and related enzymes